jgi:hypothetical protein
MKFNHPTVRSTLLACCLAAAFSAAQAEETGTTTTSGTPSATTATTTSTAVGTSTTTEAKLSAEFADFLGGSEQAGAVVSGLRQGTAFSLDAAAPTPGTTGTTSTAIDPPTGTMGYGNVRITLRLAQAELNKLGITQPTPSELSAVLLGGDINGTPIDGILTQRADGMGWGQIAQQYGMSVGQLMGKGAGLTKTATTTAAPQTKTSAKAGGYISSSPAKASSSAAHANGYIPSGKSHGAGIVTATGGSVGVAETESSKGQGNKPAASGANAVSAGSQHLAGVSNAGGSKAMAPGLAKKN